MRWLENVAERNGCGVWGFDPTSLLSLLPAEDRVYAEGQAFVSLETAKTYWSGYSLTVLAYQLNVDFLLLDECLSDKQRFALSNVLGHPVAHGTGVDYEKLAFSGNVDLVIYCLRHSRWMAYREDIGHE